jgi:hypothetical protein
MRYLLTTEQAEIMQVVENFKATLKIKAAVNEELGLPLIDLDDALNLNKLYGIFFSSLGNESK